MNTKEISALCKELNILELTVINKKSFSFIYNNNKYYIPSEKVLFNVFRNLQNGLPILFVGCLVDFDE